jgi:homotetrameric cytidine deaminase
LAAAGVSVRLAARVGSADAAYHREALAAAGVEARLTVDPELPTGSIVVVVGADATRSMFTDRGANGRLGADGELAPSLLEGVGHLHVAGHALLEPGSRAAVAGLWDAAGRSGLCRSVDAGSAALLGSVGTAFLDSTAGADLLVANAAEGAILTGASGARAVIEVLLQHYPLVALKRGAAGAVVATRSEWRDVAAPEVVVVDPTGAGDAFCAGFLASWLGGADPAEAGASGAAAAAAALATIGGRPLPRLPDEGGPGGGPPWERLRQAARSVSGRAFAPYSGFQVGAAGVTGEGVVVTGCNVENASFGLTLCAECGLVSALRAAGGQQLVAVSVVAPDGQPVSPCGRCRQVLLDNGGPALLLDQGPGVAPVRLGDLLPHSFSAEALSPRRP